MQVKLSSTQTQQLISLLDSCKCKRNQISNVSEGTKVKYWLRQGLKYLAKEQAQKEDLIKSVNHLLKRFQCVVSGLANRINYKESIAMLEKAIANKATTQQTKTQPDNSEEKLNALLSFLITLSVLQNTQEKFMELRALAKNNEALKQQREILLNLTQSYEQLSVAAQDKGTTSISQLKRYIQTASNSKCFDKDIVAEFQKLSATAKNYIKPLNQEVLRMRSAISGDKSKPELGRLQGQFNNLQSVFRQIAALIRDPLGHTKNQQLEQVQRDIAKVTRDKDLRQNIQYAYDFIAKSKDQWAKMPAMTKKPSSQDMLQQQAERLKKENQSNIDKLTAVRKQAQDLRYEMDDKIKLLKDKDGIIQTLRQQIESKSKESPSREPNRTANYRNENNFQPKQQRIQTKPTTSAPILNEQLFNLKVELSALQRDNKMLLSQNDRLKERLSDYEIKHLQQQSVSQPTKVQSLQFNEAKLMQLNKNLEQTANSLRGQLHTLRNQLRVRQDISLKCEKLEEEAKKREERIKEFMESLGSMKQAYRELKDKYENQAHSDQKLSLKSISSGEVSPRQSPHPLKQHRGEPLKFFLN